MSRRLEGAPFDSGLGGRLVTRFSVRGGCGNELMLTVFRIVLPPVTMLETARGWGSAAVGAGVVGGRNVLDGARMPLLGVLGVDLLAGVVRLPVLLRVLPTGRAGRAVVGGPFDGRAVLGSAVAMLEVCKRARHDESAKALRQTCSPTRKAPLRSANGGSPSPLIVGERALCTVGDRLETWPVTPRKGGITVLDPRQGVQRIGVRR